MSDFINNIYSYFLGIFQNKCSNNLVEGNSDVFNDYVKGDLIRLAYSYLIFIVFAYMLIKFQTDPNKRYTHK